MANEIQINRESLKKSLVDRYNEQHVGGSYDAKKELKTTGTNRISIGDSTFDSLLTVNKGFKLQMKQGETEFKDAATGDSSLQLSRYMGGFDNRKYSNNNI